MFVFIADAHLQHRAWKDFPEMSGDAFFSFEQVARTADSLSLPLVIGGDIFDIPNPEPELVTKYLRILEQYSLDVYFVEGQHDRRFSFSRNYSWAGVYPKARNIDKKTITIGNQNIYGLSWRSSTFIDEELANIPKDIDILVSHQVWGDWMPHVYDAKFEQIANASLVLTGDLHAPVDQKHVGRNGQEMRVLSPGPLCMQSSSERADKYHYIVKDKDTISSHQLITRPSFRINMDSSVTLEDLEILISIQMQETKEISNDNYSEIRHFGYENLPSKFDRPLAILDARMSSLTQEQLLPIEQELRDKTFLIYYRPNSRVSSIKAGMSLNNARSIDELFRGALERRSLTSEMVNDLMAFRQEDEPKKLAEAIRDRFLQ